MKTIYGRYEERDRGWSGRGETETIEAHQFQHRLSHTIVQK